MDFSHLKQFAIRFPKCKTNSSRNANVVSNKYILIYYIYIPKLGTGGTQTPLAHHAPPSSPRPASYGPTIRFIVDDVYSAGFFQLDNSLVYKTSMEYP